MSFPNNRHGNTPPYLLSAYGIAVKHGYSGTEEEWLASLKGDQGEYPRMQFDSETGYLQIRYDDSGEWTDIASLADLMTESEEAVVASAKEYADTAEAYAKGTVDDEAVEEGDPGYEDNAKYYAGQASNYASAAGSFAVGASNYAQIASGYATTASGHADNAATSATAAAGSASDAAGSATSASTSAGSAATSASAAEAQATQAGTYAYNADQSAQAAASYAAAANTAYGAVVDVANAVDVKVEDIETQVSIAAGYATNAGTSATNAATSATAASGSATAAAGSATAAAGSASNAADSATAAAGSATAAAGSATSVSESAAQITTNKNDIAELKSALTSVTELPSGYQQLEYLESSGTQVIAAGSSKLDQDSRVVVRFARIEDNNANYIFGSRASTSSRAFFATILRGNTLEAGYGSSGTQLVYPYQLAKDRVYELDFNKNKFYLNGELIHTFNEYTFEAPTSLRVFAIRGNSASSMYYGTVRIYSFKRYQDGTLQHDCVPVRRLSDNALGFVNLIDGTFFENSGTGTFINGNDTNIQQLAKDVENISADLIDKQTQIDDIQAEIAPKEYVQIEANRVADKVRSVQTGNTISFVAVSDLHYSVDTEAVRVALEDMKNGILKIAEQTYLDFYACFGDVIWRLSSDGNFAKGKAEMIGCTKLLNEAFGNNKQIRVVGNHDPNSEGATGYFTTNELNSFFGIYSDVLTKRKQGDTDLSNLGIGTWDLERQKVRIIVLNTSWYGQSETPDQRGTTYRFTWMQAYNLCQMLDLSEKEDADEWQIVIFSHVALDIQSQTDICKHTAVLNAYVNGSTWTGSTYSYNFSGKNSAKLAVYINGHAHKYNVKNMRNVNGSGTVLNTLSMANLDVPNALPDRDGVSFDGVTYTKTANTAESTAFQIITLDPVNKVVYAHHYGAGIDIIMHYDPTTTGTFSTTLTDPVWASNDDTIATVSSGTATPVSAGYVMIWAKSETDNCIECWNYQSVV